MHQFINVKLNWVQKEFVTDEGKVVQYGRLEATHLETGLVFELKPASNDVALLKYLIEKEVKR